MLPMTEGEYRVACLCRNPEFRDSVLMLHQTYPTLFVRSRRGRSVAELKAALDSFGRRRRARVSFQDRVAVLSPQTWEDLQAIGQLEIVFTLGRWHTRRPEYGRRYFTTLHARSQREWRKDFSTLRPRWPWISADGLCRPWRATSRPELHTVTSPGQVEVPAGAQAVIWVYPGMTAADLEALAKPASWMLTSPSRRQSLEVLARRLLVWDAYQREGTFRGVAKTLSLPPTTVRGLYMQACQDIYGHDGAREPLRRVTIDPARHAEGCPQCRAAEHGEQLCAAARAFVNQDQHAGRWVVG